MGFYLVIACERAKVKIVSILLKGCRWPVGRRNRWRYITGATRAWMGLSGLGELSQSHRLSWVLGRWACLSPESLTAEWGDRLSRMPLQFRDPVPTLALIWLRVVSVPALAMCFDRHLSFAPRLDPGLSGTSRPFLRLAREGTR